MNMFLLEMQSNEIDSNFLNRLLDGGSVVLRGMCTVFAVLAIIWFFLYLSRLLLHDLPEKMAQQRSATAQAQAPAEVAAEPDGTATDDGELIAVLSAAIAAAESESGCSFRVVSFHRVNK